MNCVAYECISLTCEHVLTTSDCRSCNCKNACKEGCAGSVPPDLDYYSPERLFFELCCDHCEYNDEICKNVLGIPVYSVCNLKPSEDNQIYELNQVPDTCPCMTRGGRTC